MHCCCLSFTFEMAHLLFRGRTSVTHVRPIGMKRRNRCSGIHQLQCSPNKIRHSIIKSVNEYYNSQTCPNCFERFPQKNETRTIQSKPAIQTAFQKETHVVPSKLFGDEINPSLTRPPPQTRLAIQQAFREPNNNTNNLSHNLKNARMAKNISGWA